MELTLDDLWRLIYFTGHDVTLTIAGGHETVEQVRHNGLIYSLPNDLPELLALIESNDK